jgi:hypothetical protein
MVTSSLKMEPRRLFGMLLLAAPHAQGYWASPAILIHGPQAPSRLALGLASAPEGADNLVNRRQQRMMDHLAGGGRPRRKSLLHGSLCADLPCL